MNGHVSIAEVPHGDTHFKNIGSKYSLLVTLVIINYLQVGRIVRCSTYYVKQ